MRSRRRTSRQERRNSMRPACLRACCCCCSCSCTAFTLSCACCAAAAALPASPTYSQARGKLAATSSSIAQLYSLVAQATAATSAQLDATAAVLQQQAASRPAAAHEPLPPGPDEVCVAHTHANLLLCPIAASESVPAGKLQQQQQALVPLLSAAAPAAASVALAHASRWFAACAGRGGAAGGCRDV